MFSKKRVIFSVLVLLVVGILGSQTFLPSGFFNDSNRVFALVYGTTSNTVAVTSISLDKQTLNMIINEKTKLNATLKPSNSTRKTPSWCSSNKKVVTVAKDGTITAVGVGKATISAFTETQCANCNVIVSAKPILVTGVTIDKALTLKVSETKQLVAVINPANATNKALTWTSSNSAIASVDTNGKITAKKVGTAKITVKTKDGNKTSICSVTVVKPVLVTGVTIDKTLTLKVGATKQFVAVIKPTNATNKAVTWTSSSITVATVDANGKVTAKKAGTAKITVKTNDGNKTSICTVTVK